MLKSTVINQAALMNKLSLFSKTAFGSCSSSGNIVIYSNYDGGVLNIKYVYGLVA